MANTVANFSLGPATVYCAPFGTAEPAGTADPGAGWTDLGGTNGGVTVNITDEYTELRADQDLMVGESRRTNRTGTVTLSLFEATLENLKIALSGGTVTTSTGFKSYAPTGDVVSGAPGYLAVILVGQAPGAQKSLFIARKVLSTEGTEFAYSREDGTGFSMTLKLHKVSSSVTPYEYRHSTV